MRKFFLSVALVLGTTALVGCSEETTETSGNTDSGDQPEVVEKYMGMTVFPKDMLRVADVAIQAEAGGVQLFADTVRSAEVSTYGTNALFDEIVLRCYPLVFDPDVYYVYYGDLGIPKQNVVWTARTLLNADKVNALTTDTIIQMHRPDVVIAVQDPNKFMGSGSIGHIPVIKSKLNKFFEDERRTFNSDTLYVAQ